MDAHGDFIIGKGLGWIPDRFSLLYRHTERWVQLHNDFLESLVIFGVIGSTILILFLFHTFNQEKNKTVANPPAMPGAFDL